MQLHYFDLRYIKAGIILYITHIARKRDQVRSRQFVPARILDAISERIRYLTELAEHGVLKNLRPAEVLFDLEPDILVS